MQGSLDGWVKKRKKAPSVLQVEKVPPSNTPPRAPAPVRTQSIKFEARVKESATTKKQVDVRLANVTVSSHQNTVDEPKFDSPDEEYLRLAADVEMDYFSSQTHISQQSAANGNGTTNTRKRKRWSNGSSGGSATAGGPSTPRMVKAKDSREEEELEQEEVAQSTAVARSRQPQGSSPSTTRTRPTTDHW